MLILFLFLFISGSSFAEVTGICSNCHTMHNSQGGTSMITGYDPGTGPYPTLLRYNGCLGCHASTNGGTSTEPVTGAPIVYNTAAPTYGDQYNGGPNQGLAGGNFYWVAQGGAANDAKGHNIFSQDANLELAPGRTKGCDVNDSCHVNLHEPYTDPKPEWDGRSACTGCHMISDTGGPIGYHHADKPDPGNPIVAFPWYRFLEGHKTAAGRGVVGIEDPDWQRYPTESVHNEYLGGYVYLPMSLYCSGCHNAFHSVAKTDGGWIRHPSDATIPTTGEYGSYTTYDPLVPVGRASLTGWTEPSSTVTPGEDMVMCLSCHRPHGSPYPDMLRWDYSGMTAGGGGSGGCFKCHSEKN